jgi:hypothetical protein
MKIPESKRSEIGIIAEFSGIPNRFPNLVTDGRNYRQRNKYTCCAWAGGTFFPVVLLCQCLVLAGNRF